MGMKKVFDQFAPGPVRVNAAQCLRSRHRKSHCERCAAVCPVEGALTLESRPHVEANRCLSCGLCATACPTGALIAAEPSDVQLVRSLEDIAKVRPWAAFACPEAAEQETRPPAGTTLTVPCLGRLDASILIGGIAGGLQTIGLIQGPCATCRKGRDGQTADFVAAQVDTANRLLSAVGRAPAVQIITELTAEAVQEAAAKAPLVGAVSRRDLFGLLLRETTWLGANVVEDAIDQVAPAPEETPAHPGLPVALPERIARLLAVLRRLGPGEEPDAVLEGGPWAQFGITTDCNGCQLCAFFCPTGALSKIERDGRAGVAFRAAACTNCGLCVEACLMEAVTLAERVDVRKILDDTVEELWMREVQPVDSDQATRDIILRQFRQ